MRRSFIIAWAFLLAGLCCIQQSSAFWQSRDSNYNVNIATSYQGLVDAVSGATEYWSCARAATNAVAQAGSPACDVVDTATGLTSCTLDFLSTGFVNKTQCNATACAVSCSVSKLYGQINGIPLTQGTLADMPVLTFNSINGLPALKFGGGSNNGLTGTITTQVQPFTQGAVFTRTAVTTGGVISTTNSVVIRGTVSANTLAIGCGTSTNSTITDNAWHSAQVYCDNTTSALNVDGIDSGNVQSYGTQPTGTNISIGVNGSTTLTGSIVESFLYPSTTLSTAIARGLIFTNQNGSSGYNGAL